MPEITEAKLYEAFGLKAPEPAAPGANEQAPAEPAAEGAASQTAQGANVQEPAEPATAAETGAEAGQDPVPNAQDPSQTQEPQPMTQEQRRQNAARRRAQEQQAAVDQAVNAALEAERQRVAGDMEQFFARMGMKNTFTGQPIKTMEEFNSWKSQFDSDQFGKDLKAGKATAEQFTQLIDNHPVVRQAQQVIAAGQAQQQRQQQEEAQQRIDRDIAEIGKLNPAVTSVADLLALPKADEFRSHVARGNDFLSAYKLTYFDELTEARAERARQQAVNLSRGKEHLVSSSGTGSAGTVSVPPNVMAMYRAFNPRASEAEIRAHYNKTMNKS